MDDAAFAISWEDGSVVQSEEVVMESEITEEYVTEVEGDQFPDDIQTEQVVHDVEDVEEEVVQDNSQIEEVTLGEEQHDGDLVYFPDGEVLVVGGNQETYSQEQLMAVTEEVITDQWGDSCPQEIIVGSEEAVSATGEQPIGDEDIPLPTDQDEYTAARPYPCDFCSRRFRNKANLMNHMVAHQTDRPHGCNLCGFRYTRKVDLMNHLKTHAYILDSDNVDEEENPLADNSTFEKSRKKIKPFGKRRRKKREDYEHMFTSPEAAATTSTNFDYQEEDDVRYMQADEEGSSEYLPTAEATQYPITDPKKPFVCQHCGIGFAREKALASHARVHGEDENPFECQRCGEMFCDITLMEEHARVKHGGMEDYDDDEDDDYSDSEETKYGTFYCPTCGLSFHRQDNLRRHQRIHIKEEFVNEHDFGHICNVCGESFQEALDLLAHAEVHARGSEHRCMICGEICPDENALASHVQTAHKNLPPHTCPMCGRTCKDSRALLKHSWEHSKEKSFACSKCPKTFHNRARLKRHMLSHRNKVVTCDVCGQDFPDGRSLMNHRHSHSSSSGRQFPCKECGKTFGSRSSQQIHIRIHTGERPYGCRFCWKAFADGGTLRKHERIHTGEKPYACAVCPRAFNQRVVLREHIRSHHSGPDPKYSHSMTPYCCAVCSDMFATSQDLILHLIHHCDTNTALKRQPPAGPRKYKRRRKLKQHELDLIANSQDQESRYVINREEIVEQDYSGPNSDEEQGGKKRPRRASSRKGSTSSPKTSISETVSDVYNSLNTIENANDSIAVSRSPQISKSKLTKKLKSENVPVLSRPKMIHTQKTRVPIEAGEDGRVRHKTKTLVVRTHPTAIKSSTGERIRPRTKNVSYHVLNPEKYPLATFASGDQTREAVENLLKESGEEPSNGDILTEEIVEHAPDIAAEQTIEAEAAVPTEFMETTRTRRNSVRNSRNVIGPGSKVRLVKEGMVVSKLKRNSECQNEPESILPDIQQIEMVNVKEEMFHGNAEQMGEHDTYEEEQLVSEHQIVVKQERIQADNSASVINIKQEMLDPTALHELAEISMRHASTSSVIYKCEMCDEVFSDRSQLLLHVPIHI